MIYLFDQIADISDREYGIAYDMLSEERKKRVIRYRFKRDRLLCTFAYILLMYGLNNEGCLSDIRPEFIYNSYGKPYLQTDVFNGVCFNFSHCEKGIVCGISEYELGVDIEAYVGEFAGIMDLVLHPNERKLFCNGNMSNALFTQLWTMKEAYTKMYGCGLSYEITELDFSAVDSAYNGAYLLTEQRKEYVLSVFSRQEAFSMVNFVSASKLMNFIGLLTKINFKN